MTPEDVKLREAALAATPGPWEQSVFLVKAGRITVVHTGIVGNPPSFAHQSEANASYIAAANPAAILRLLDDKAKLLDEAERLRAVAEAEPHNTGVGWENLTCDDQFILARRIAANIGYVLTPEPSIQDAEDLQPSGAGK